MSEKSNHEFIPQHDKLDNKEVKVIFEKLNLKADNLPKILSTDPQAIRAGAAVGDVLEIKRKEYGSEYKNYRLVVEG
jgi:DNA-directed RNA polymerase subunit H